MVEGIAIAILISASVTGGFSLWSIRRSNAQVSKQLETQNKIASAQLAWKILEYWREKKHERFTDFLEKLHRSEINKNDSIIPVTLTIFEDIAVLWREGTLTDNHVKEFFGNPLRDIRESRIMQDRIKKESEYNPDFILVNLRALLLETVKWKI